MISVAEAQARIAAAFGPTPVEQVDLDAAIGRTLAAAVAARRTQPPTAVSAMDGYALRAADAPVAGATLTVDRHIPAGGDPGGPPPVGTCARIFTGGALPPGADAVVIQEDTERIDEARVRFRIAAEAGAYVRPAGHDFASGETLLEPGVVVTARRAALAAAAGHVRMSVRRRPRIALLATGNEIALPGDPIGPNQIVSSNSVALRGLIRALGGDAIDLGVVVDEMTMLKQRAAQASGCDFLITMGGASVGAHDLIGGLVAEGDRAFWKIAMRPGKPLLFGRTAVAPLLGLPGNPVSAFVCGALFAQTALRTMLGRTPAAPPLTTARLVAPLEAGGRREVYLRAVFRDGGVAPLAKQDSAQFGALAAADALIRVPIDALAQAKGARVKVLPLDFD